MKLLLANIATGQLRHCASTQQVSLFSRPRFLELQGLKYITSPPPAKNVPQGLIPARTPTPPVPAPLDMRPPRCFAPNLGRALRKIFWIHETLRIVYF